MYNKNSSGETPISKAFVSEFLTRDSWHGYFLRQKFNPKNIVLSNMSLMAIFEGNHPQRGR